jgi:GNAT superfamily N-acetyltransferase
MSTSIEELSLNAWPSLQTVLYDGWVLRFADGYTKRANSVNPLYPSTLDLEEKIRFCERMYPGRTLPAVFKITPDAFQGDLDEKLSERGYRKDSPTSVQVMDLVSADVQIAREIELQEELSAEWLDSFCRMSAVSGSHRETLRKILLNILPGHCFVSLKAGGPAIACGLGVLQSGYIGLFDIVTDPSFRSRGYGRQVVESILAWGRQNGAQEAYLQVMFNNPPALRLYAKIGFIEKYQYWYRIQSQGVAASTPASPAGVTRL